MDNELTVGLCSGSQKWEFVSDETKQLLTSDEHTCCDQEEAAECGIFNECKVVSGNTKCCPNLCPVPLILPGEPNPFAVCGTDDNTVSGNCSEFMFVVDIVCVCVCVRVRACVLCERVCTGPSCVFRHRPHS